MAVIFGYGGDRNLSSSNMGNVLNYDLARSCFLLERKICLVHGILMGLSDGKMQNPEKHDQSIINGADD